ncbi:MAG: hypothetical protein WC028_02840 [Candidatus Obscuribacterales bacterium]
MSQANFERLKEHIISLSDSQIFVTAKSEWHLVAIEISDEFDNCPCGQEIKEHCYIRNKFNSNQTYVGNVCINNFLDIDTGNLFDGLKRIATNIEANPNEDLIEHANRMGYLHGENEYLFLQSIKRKRKLSEKQLRWKRLINKRILSQTKVRKRTVR